MTRLSTEEPNNERLSEPRRASGNKESQNVTEKAKRLCSMMCGKPVEKVSDMTPIEVEACLNSWAMHWEEPRGRS